MTIARTREWHPVRRPRERASIEDFALVGTDVPVVGPVGDHYDRMAAFRAEVEPWIRSGEIVHRQTVADGRERVPDVLPGPLRDGSPATGKTVVRPEVRA